MRAPEAPGSASKRDMRDESYDRKTRAPNRCHRCIDLEGKRVAAAARAARTMDFHDVDDLVPLHHDEEAEIGKVTLAATLLGILTFLVALTIFFERTQEHMIHSSVPTMKPVVRQTFAEVTVLGFLSIVTTVAGKCGLWGLLAHVVYGEEVEEEVPLSDEELAEQASKAEEEEEEDVEETDEDDE